jgi:hypothetical protein
MTDFLKDTCSALDKAHGECLQQLQSLRFVADAHNQLIAASLYCSIIEYVGTLLVLARERRRTGFSSVFRSFLEGFVDLNNMLKNDDFYFRKEASFHKKWKAFLRSVTADNPYFKAIADDPESLEESLTRHSQRFSDLKAQGHHSIDVKDCFYKAGMMDEYNAIYRFECAETHNDFRILQSRNMKVDAEGKATVGAYIAPSPDYYLSRLDIAGDLLLKASEAIHDRMGSKAGEEFKPHREALEKLLNLRWEAMKAAAGKPAAGG